MPEFVRIFVPIVAGERAEHTWNIAETTRVLPSRNGLSLSISLAPVIIAPLSAER